MFEEEGKEFQKQIQQEYLDLGKNGAYPPLWERIGELWQQGAKFGYNEGKEEMGEKLDKAKEMLEQFIKFSMFPLTTKKDIEDVQILLKSASQFCKE